MWSAAAVAVSISCGSLARYLTGQGVELAEVIRPNRQARGRGKSDAADAVAAALAALNGEASGTPKAHDGAAEAGPDAAGRPPHVLGRRSDQFRQDASSAWATGVCGGCAPLHCRLCTARGPMAGPSWRWLTAGPGPGQATLGV